MISERVRQRISAQLSRDWLQEREPRPVSAEKAEVVAVPVATARAKSAPKGKKHFPVLLGPTATPSAANAGTAPPQAALDVHCLPPLTLSAASEPSEDILLTLDTDQLFPALDTAHGPALAERLHQLFAGTASCAIDLSAQRLLLNGAELPFTASPLTGLQLHQLDLAAKHIKRL